MNYRVDFETRAKKEFLKLAAGVRQDLADVIDDLAENPRPPGAKKLVGQNGYRVRQGDYRILYLIDDRARLVRIYRVGNRRDVYR